MHKSLNRQDSVLSRFAGIQEDQYKLCNCPRYRKAKGHVRKRFVRGLKLLSQEDILHEVAVGRCTTWRMYKELLDSGYWLVLTSDRTD